MPGIFGSIDRTGHPVPEELAVEMAGSLKHENTYVSNWVIGSCLLGAVELGSICGRNVFDDAEMMLTGASRGHIYNKDELSERFGVKPESSFLNDVRFIMQLYEKSGDGFAKYINGLFIAALYDKEKDRVLVINDRYGFYPMFYFLGDERFVFASEVKPILKDPTFVKSIDNSAIPEFFSFNQLIGDTTFFQRLKWLRPATVLVYDRLKDQVFTQQYWDFSMEHRKEHGTADLDVLLNSFKRLMMKAVKRAVQDKKEIGVFLSGGLDSRNVAAFASETGVDVVTFTFGARNCPQREIAKRVAEELGLENVFYEIPSDFISNFAAKIVYQGDGLIRIRDCHSIAVLERISRVVDTVLMGTLGESLFGYNSDALFHYIKKKGNFDWRSLDSVKEYILSHAIRGLPLDMYFEAFVEGFDVRARQMIIASFEKEFSWLLGNDRFNTAVDLVNYWDYRVLEQRYIFQAFQFINWYVETRHPFLDSELVDFFAFKLPIQLQLGERFLNKALNYCFPALGKIPLESGARPDAGQIEVIMGRMRGFAHRKVKETLELVSKGKMSIRAADYRDYGKWLRTGSKDYVQSLLLSPESLNRGFFKREFIERMVFEHMTARKDHDGIICDLINFELMNRMFFEKRREDPAKSVSSG